ncbi:hypothetical protein, partial [Stenotrophomonas sp. SrG]|uniref:hypothetical protein n=1 Tax=Stenotrophomonas sp. SrG TaxID=3414430 RepID=UPI003CE8D83B
EASAVDRRHPVLVEHKPDDVLGLLAHRLRLREERRGGRNVAVSAAAPARGVPGIMAAAV